MIIKYIEYLMETYNDIIMKKIGCPLTKIEITDESCYELNNYIFEDIEKHTYNINVIITKET
jgi:hypothetical protein